MVVFLFFFMIKIDKTAKISSLALIGFIPENFNGNKELETVIDENCIIEPFAIVYAGSFIGKNTIIKSGAQVGVVPKTRSDLIGAKIGENSNILSNAIIEADVESGEKFTADQNCFIQYGCKFGNFVGIGQSTSVLYKAKLGDSIRVHTLCMVGEFVEIGNNSWIGPSCNLTNAPHPKCVNVKLCEQDYAVKVKEFVRIGANSTILPGVVLNNNVIVGANSVVSKSVEEGKVVVGNPAKVVKETKDLTCWDSLKYNVEKPY